MVQPFTVMVLAETDPGPPVVIELDTEPPPACTCTPVEPAELLLETLPAPLLLPAEAPAALILPSACFSTETVHRSPDAVFPVLTIVSEFAVAPIAAVSANAVATVHARVMFNSSRLKRRTGDGGCRPPDRSSILVLLHLMALAAIPVVALAMFHAGGACRGTGRANGRAALAAARRRAAGA
jgi:hypothetical protein